MLPSIHPFIPGATHFMLILISLGSLLAIASAIRLAEGAPAKRMLTLTLSGLLATGAGLFLGPFS